MKIIDKIKYLEETEIKILSMPILQYGKTKIKNSTVSYLKIFSKNDLINNVKNKFLNLLAKEEINIEDYDDIYFLWNKSGETYLFMTLAKYFFNKNGTQKPLFITRCEHAYARNIAKMFFPDATCAVLPLKHEDRLIIEQLDKINNHKIYNIFPISIFYKLEQSIQQGENIHILDCITRFLNISNNSVEFETPIISEDVEKSLGIKIEELNLDINNFVLISPEAQSNPSISNNFWINLKTKLENAGYDTFFNIELNKNFIGKVKHCHLSHQEAYALTLQAKAVIGLRSGFLEVISQAGVDKPYIALYTPFKQRGYKNMIFPPQSAQNVIKMSSLKKLPNVSAYLYEYDTENIDEEELLNSIMRQIIKK